MSATAARLPADPTARDRELLTRLGLPPAASPEEIETAHQNVIDYLARAPRDLRAWARQQATDADTAYAFLLDPAVLTDSDALVGPARAAAQPGGPATPPAHRAHSRPSANVLAAPVSENTLGGTDDEVDDLDELDALAAEVSPDLHRDVVGGGPAPKVAAKRPSSGSRRGRGVRRLAVIGLIALGAVGIAVTGYNAGAPPTSAAGGGTTNASPSPGLDQAKVAALMTKIQANPKDTESLFGLADEYFAANDFATAEIWLTKLLAIDPKDVRALVALGAAKFNEGDVPTAEAKWNAAIAIDPTSVEAHYDLGFLYFSAQPQDIAGVRREWGKVIELAPGTDLAKTVQAHLDSLASPAPSGATGGSPAPSGGSPVPSGAPSAPSSAASVPPASAPAASNGAAGSSQP
jgi:tetratricopeptide (TPR) repeat protein